MYKYTRNCRCNYYYYYCCYYMDVCISGLFFLVLLLNQRWSPSLRLQNSHCSTFRIMCDVPSTAVFCSESTECFPGTASRSFLKLLVTIPVAPVITGIIVHFRFHIQCISIHKPVYFNVFSASFCTIIIIIIIILRGRISLTCCSDCITHQSLSIQNAYWCKITRWFFFHLSQ